MPGPYAVRVRTADGWQDIALQGPPGPQGVPGGAYAYNVVDDATFVQDGQITMDLVSQMSTSVLQIAYIDANGVSQAGLVQSIKTGDNIILRGATERERFIQFRVTGRSLGVGYDTFNVVAEKRDAFQGGPSEMILALVGPTGASGPPGGTQMYYWQDSGGWCSSSGQGTSRRIVPIRTQASLITAQCTKSDGTNPDFVLNPNKTLQIVRAGFYEVSASVGPSQSPSAAVGYETHLALADTTTGTDSYSWNFFDEQRYNIVNTVTYGALNRHAIGRYFNANDNLALLCSWSDGAYVKDTDLYYFSIHRVGSGEKGEASTVPGPPGTVNPYQIGQTWGIGGALTAGMVVPQIFVPKRSNQSVTVVGASAVINSGGSIGVQLQRNGVNLGSLLTVTTAPTNLSGVSQALAHGDRLKLVTSAPSGSPADLSYTVFLEHTAT